MSVPASTQDTAVDSRADAVEPSAARADGAHGISSLAPALAAMAGVALVVGWLAYEGGTYGVIERTTFAVAAWWTILLGVVSGLLPLERLGRPTLVVGGLLAAFTAWTGISIAWAPSAERAFVELDRAALFLGVFLLAVLLGTRRNGRGWADGLGIAIAGIGILSLVSRLFADDFPVPDTLRILQPEGARLDYPLDYANGLGIFVAIGLPFLLHAASRPRPLLAQALGVAAIPALAATLYLTSSRGGAITAAIACVGYLALTSERAATVAALLAGGLGTTGVVYLLLQRSELVNRPLEPAAAAEGASAAPLILGLCLGAAVAYIGLQLVLRALGRRTRLVLAAAAAALLIPAIVAGIAAADPIERFHAFREPPSAAPTVETNDPNRAHLLSLNGAGRWQYWKASVEQFEEHTMFGQGAGSYEAWWAQHGEVAMFIRDAHSLYAETLGELGLVGFLLLAGVFVAALVTLAVRVVRARGHEQALVAAFGAAFIAFAVGAAVDWIWELTVVSVVGIACLGLLVGPATAAGSAEAPRRLDRRLNVGLRAAVALAAVAAFVCQAILLASESELRASRDAAGRADTAAAIEHAERAHDLQPWAASPALQLALVAERTGDLETARRWAATATRRDATDWRLWLVRARVETLSGRIAAGRRSLDRAVELNPRSPLFASFTEASR